MTMANKYIYVYFEEPTLVHNMYINRLSKFGNTIIKNSIAILKYILKLIKDL